jgi:hypothetical protein
MAARGRFGRSDTGTSNLSALIRQLVSQQQAQEEKALMDAFYGGMQYNGSVPTMADVKAFYAKWADLTGEEPGTSGWELVQQKVEQANNFDINRTYKILQNEFSASLGGNFQAIVEFLNGRAKESTDPNDSVVFDSALAAFSRNYINYRGDDLIRGVITLDQFRVMSDQALSMVSPDDPQYQAMKIDSYSAEWKSEATRRNNLVIGGEMSKSAYIKWIKSFRDAMLAAGVPKIGALYADISAELGRITRVSGGGAASTKLDAIGSDITALWNGISALVGTDKKFNFGDSKTLSSILNDITDNPDYVEAAADLLDNNPSSVPQSLLRLGITDGQSLRDVFRTTVGKGRDQADYLASIGVDSNYSKWVWADNIAGGTNVLGVLKHIDDQWKKMSGEALGDEVKLRSLNDEYINYLKNVLNGNNELKTIFGKVPIGSATQDVADLVQAQLDALQGRGDGRTNISTYNEDGTELDKAKIATSPQNIFATDDNANQIMSGQKVLVYDKNSGTFNASTPINKGVSAGYYHKIVLDRTFDGQLYAKVQIYKGDSVDGSRLGLGAYQTEDGIVLIDPNGNEWDTSAYTVDDTGKVSVADGMTETSDNKGAAPIVSYDNLMRKIPEVIGETPLAEIQKLDAESLRAGAQAVSAVVGGLDNSSRQIVDDNINKMVSDANMLDSVAMSMEPSSKQSLDTKIAIADSQGKSDYADFLRTKAKFYTETSDGIWALKPQYADQQQLTGLESVMGGRDQSGILSFLSIPSNIVQGVQDFFQGNNLQPVVDFRENKFANTANVNWAQSRGYAPANPVAGNPFFRNLAPSTLPTPQQLTVPTSAPLSFQPLTPIAPPKPIAPISQALTPLGSKDLMGVAGDSLLERRDTLIRLNAQSASLTPINSAGKGGGGV